MKILIHKRNNTVEHSGSWGMVWAQYCRENNIDYDELDLFSIDPIAILNNYDCLLWHFGNYIYEDMLEARSILYTAKQMGLKIFPDFNDAWHFDDKIAQMYALKSVGAPIPKSWVFYDMQRLKECLSELEFPIVAKLRTGSGSHNVKLIKSENQLISYAKKMFNKGFSPAPSLMYKASSNIRSSHDWKTIISKYKRIPEFLRTLSGAKKFPNEKGYVYLQEFVPNDNFDMKIIVVGDKLTGLYRPTRSHDFRASGGGEVLYDKNLISNDIIDSAFATADKLKLKCIGYDYVIDKRSKKGLIIEMSYGFSHTALMGSGGYYDRNHNWYDEPLNAPVEILKNLLD